MVAAGARPVRTVARRAEEMGGLIAVRQGGRGAPDSCKLRAL